MWIRRSDVLKNVLKFQIFSVLKIKIPYDQAWVIYRLYVYTVCCVSAVVMWKCLMRLSMMLCRRLVRRKAQTAHSAHQVSEVDVNVRNARDRWDELAQFVLCISGEVASPWPRQKLFLVVCFAFIYMLCIKFFVVTVTAAAAAIIIIIVAVPWAGAGS